jgi:hypothetical protein
VVGQGAIDAVVYAARVKVGFKLLINWLRIMLVKPLIEFFALRRRKSVYRAFNLLYSVQVHASLLPRLGGVTRGKEG